MIAFNMEQWSDYLDEDALKEYAHAGYYSQSLKLKNGTVYDKVKVVAVTTQPMYNFNFYLWGERDDPGNVLAWLEATLREMENNHEIAIIISHVPPNAHCGLYQWSVRYRAIMERF